MMTADGWPPSSGGRLGPVLRYVGITREALAERMAVSVDSINSWCSGRVRMRLAHVTELARALSEAGAPADLLRGLLSAQLAQHGMSADVLRLLRGSEDAPFSGKPVLFIGSQLTTGGHQMVIFGFHDAMRAFGEPNILYLDTCGRQDIFNRYLELAFRSPIGGIALALPGLAEPEAWRLAERLISRGLPCVFVDLGLERTPPGSAFVKIDNHGAAALATNFLWSLGHRRILALALDGMTSQRERARGYIDTISALGARPRLTWTLAENGRLRSTAAADRPDPREAAELIACDMSTTGVLALSANAAMALVGAFRRAQRVPGRDVALIVIGCRDWMHDISSPPITHVALPYYEAGQQSARLLLKPGGPAGPRVVHVPLPGTIHFRDGGSVAPPAC